MENELKNLRHIKCSPLTKKNKFTCLENNTLLELRELWNHHSPNKQITTTNPHEIWKKFKIILKSKCNSDESCWLTQKFTNGKFIHHANLLYAPKPPKEWKKNPKEWLSSEDIERVMDQYEKAYPCFTFLGPTPIDFDKRQKKKCVWDEMCNFQLSDQIARQKSKIGIVINLDKHTQGGSHWVSMFINIKKRFIFYFDSAGEKIKKKILVFVKRVMKQAEELGMPCGFDQNHPTEHQYGDSECGIYALFFIVHMLEDKITSHYLKTHVIKDKYMHKFRKVYFN